jgi:hypothetical protein
MPALHDDLADFIRAIVRGDETTSRINMTYPNYPVAVALDVYRNNYRGNLHDALAGVYPVIAQLVGKDFFRLLTRKYIEKNPSRSGNLHHYGAEMAGFIASFKPARDLPYLADVAALEWACHCAYFAEDAATFDFNKLAEVPPVCYGDLVLHIHPASHLVRSRYPVAAIWHAHQSGVNNDFHIDLDRGPCNALVCRKNGVVLVRELTEPDAAWLQDIHTGTPLGVATAATQKLYPEFDLQAALLYLAGQEVLTGFSLRNIP